MDNGPTVSDLIARRIRELRNARGMTVAELAEGCKSWGMPKLTAQTLYKLEGQRDASGRPPRPVTIDELLVLAAVLDVAPVHLIAGLGDDDETIPVSPAWNLTAAGARAWIRGLAPIRGRDRKRYEANVPASEENMRWIVLRDVTSYEDLEQGLDRIKALITLTKQNEAGDLT